MMPAWFKNPFRKNFQEKPDDVKLSMKDIAWSENASAFSATDFTKYNPDALMGMKGFQLYKNMMCDEQIKAVIKFKRDAMTSRDYTFELDCDQAGMDECEAQRRIDMSYAIIDNMRGSWMDALNGIMSAMQNGFSMSEKVFNQFEYDGLTYWGIEKIKVKPFDTFSFKVDDYGNVDAVIQTMGQKEQKVDLDKFIHFVMNPDIDEHYGQSELRECYRAWFNKDILIKYRTMWLERHVGGFRWFKVNEGNLDPNSAEYSAMQDVLKNINTQTGLILPPNIDIDSEYPANNAAFKEAIADQDTAIARALLVPNLLGITPQGDTGSYSQSTNQLEAFLWTLEADTQRLEDAINEQLFRQLGEANFGPGVGQWPQYRFKPPSKAKVLELVNTWKDLIASGAVTHNMHDEVHLRELLDMPLGSNDDQDEEITATRPDTALNGGQVSSMLEVIAKVQDGTLSQEAAISVLTASFPLSISQATEIVKDIEVKEPEELLPPGQEGEEGDEEDSDDDDGNNGGDNPASGNDDNPVVEETIVGRGLVSVSAFKKALRRIDFAVIDRTTEQATERHADAVATTMGEVAADLFEKAKTGGDLNEDLTANIKAIRVDPKLKSKLKRECNATLRDGYKIGLKHGQKEIDRAKGTDFSRTFKTERMDLIAEDYFKVTSFRMTGNLTDEAVKIVEQIILSGAKYDWTWEQIETEIYTTFASKGMITEEQAKDALLDAYTGTNPQHRVNTMIRTNLFDAINIARYDYFTDPDLDGFVTAFEYSAILDDRTTEICKHLDEDNAGNHSVEWYESNQHFRPPNHYNCRSILVPVTEMDDDFKEGGQPSIQPQAGFGGGQ